MDQQQQQQQHIPDDQNSNISGAQYGFYQPDHDQSYGIPYNQQQIQPYQHVITHHAGAPPRGFSNAITLANTC
jgi:hypothetical protein